MNKAWIRRAKYEPLFVRWVLVVSWLPVILLLIGAVLEFLFPGRESHPLYFPLIILGMFVIPLSWIAAVIGSVIVAFLACFIRTPATIVLGAQAFGIIPVLAAKGIWKYFEDVSNLLTLDFLNTQGNLEGISNTAIDFPWGGIQYLVFIVSSLVAVGIRMRSGKSPKGT